MEVRNRITGSQQIRQSAFPFCLRWQHRPSSVRPLICIAVFITKKYPPVEPTRRSGIEGRVVDNAKTGTSPCSSLTKPKKTKYRYQGP